MQNRFCKIDELKEFNMNMITFVVFSGYYESGLFSAKFIQL